MGGYDERALRSGVACGRRAPPRAVREPPLQPGQGEGCGWAPGFAPGGSRTAPTIWAGRGLGVGAGLRPGPRMRGCRGLAMGPGGAAWGRISDAGLRRTGPPFGGCVRAPGPAPGGSRTAPTTWAGRGLRVGAGLRPGPRMRGCRGLAMGPGGAAWGRIGDARLRRTGPPFGGCVRAPGPAPGGSRTAPTTWAGRGLREGAGPRPGRFANRPYNLGRARVAGGRRASPRAPDAGLPGAGDGARWGSLGAHQRCGATTNGPSVRGLRVGAGPRPGRFANRPYNLGRARVACGRRAPPRAVREPPLQPGQGEGCVWAPGPAPGGSRTAPTTSAGPRMRGCRGLAMGPGGAAWGRISDGRLQRTGPPFGGCVRAPGPAPGGSRTAPTTWAGRGLRVGAGLRPGRFANRPYNLGRRGLRVGAGPRPGRFANRPYNLGRARVA